MLRYMPFTNWIAETWTRGGCGGHVLFAIALVLLIWPFWLFWLPFDVLIGFLRYGNVGNSKRRDDFRPYGMVSIDIETTGLNPSKDEILSIGIVSADGQVLMDELVRPMKHKTWKGAQAVNGISPAMVADRRSFATFRPRVQQIVDGSSAVMFYNADFDVPFLQSAGIAITCPVVDVMLEYANRHGGEWAKLADAAESYGIELKDAHTASADAWATMMLYMRMNGQGGAQNGRSGAQNGQGGAQPRPSGARHMRQ